MLRRHRNTLGVGLEALRWRVHSLPPRRRRTHRCATDITAIVPTYLPTRRAGSEVTLHDLLVRLAMRGFTCRVVTTEDLWSGEVGGIEVAPLDTSHEAEPIETGIVFTQLGARPIATRIARRSRSRLVVFQHMGGIAPAMRWAPPDLIVYNSASVREADGSPQRSIVVHPPIDAERYRVDRGSLITQIGLSELKGADTFWALAERMPDRKFLAVKNAYAEQVLPNTIPSNVKVLEPLDDIRDAYRQTRLILMPSRFETFGRVALEAAASGIPTIAHPSPGLREAIGDAAIWEARDKPEEWVRSIQALDNIEIYERYSTMAKSRLEQFNPDLELELLIDQLGPPG